MPCESMYGRGGDAPRVRGLECDYRMNSWRVSVRTEFGIGLCTMIAWGPDGAEEVARGDGTQVKAILGVLEVGNLM